MSSRSFGMPVRLLVVLLSLLLTALEAQPADRSAKTAQPKEPAEQKFLREAEAKLDRLFLMGDQTLADQLAKALYDPKPILERIEDIERKGPEEIRSRATALGAKIRRVAMAEPTVALEAVLEDLMAREQIQSWKKEFSENQKTILAKWQDEVTQARRDRVEPPAKPEHVLFAPLPSAKEWNVDGENARCAVEAGLCLVSLNERQTALELFRLLGESHREDVIGVLAEEGGGDAFMVPGSYTKAADLYGHAIKVCRHLIGYLKIDDFGEIAHLQRRIEHKLAEAKRLADTEAYGPGYCAYRECQRLRCVEGDLLRAHVAYEDLATEFPKTVFAAASEAYRLKILLALSDPEQETNAKKTLAQVEKDLADSERELKAAEREKVVRKDKNLRDLLRDMLDQQRTRLERLQKIPLGARAAKEAENREGELLRDEFGLYRGEILVDLATHALERELDTEQAERRYQKAWAWLEKVGSVDAALDAYDVPDKAQQVSRPPQKELTIDRMGNVGSAGIGYHMIQNRRTSPWYLNDLREKCALAIGFLHFVKEENDAALAWYAKVVELDEATGYLQRKGEWTNYSRLKWGAEHGYLYAYPQELKLYDKRQKPAVLLADFYYCTGRFQQAEVLFQDLLQGRFGMLKPAQQDYPNYAVGACRYWSKGRKAACEKYAEVLSRTDGTFSEVRAAYALGHLAALLKDEALKALGVKALQGISGKKDAGDFAYRATIQQARALLAEGKTKEGIRLLGSIPKSADGYFLLAQRFIQSEQQKAQE